MSAELPVAVRAVAPPSPSGRQRRARARVRDALAHLDTRRSRVLAVALVVSAFTWLALKQSVGSAELRLESEISPVPVAPSRCRAHGDQALAHARVLEQLASASWERVPFDPRESPRAVEQIAESEACFAEAHDRTGRLRTASAYYRYSADLERRFTRARLLLRIAVRADERRERAPQTGGGPGTSHALSKQILELLALLERAPPSARAYRSELQRLARRVGGAWWQAQTPQETTVTADLEQPERTP